MTFFIRTQDGQRQYSIRWESSSPNPASIFGLYALPQGLPVLGFAMMGIGQPWEPGPPTSDSIAVLIASDREGMFGRQCGSCGGYWRSGGAAARWPTVCPYCGRSAPMHKFVTPAQLRYVRHYTATLTSAIYGEADEAEVVIDMDQYADRSNREGDLPAFYYAEESQQSRWTCTQCRNSNDILGHYGYCCSCGYRNNIDLMQADIASIRDRSVDGLGDAHRLLQELVSKFEGFGRDLVEQLLQRVPITPARRRVLEALRFHNLNRAREIIAEVFDIDMFSGLSDEKRDFAQVKFLRRNLYEHRAGVVDQEYIDISRDVTVRLGQRISEHPGEVRRLADAVSDLAENLSEGFHQMLPAQEAAIRTSRPAV